MKPDRRTEAVKIVKSIAERNDCRRCTIKVTYIEPYRLGCRRMGLTAGEPDEDASSGSRGSGSAKHGHGHHNPHVSKDLLRYDFDTDPIWERNADGVYSSTPESELERMRKDQYRNPRDGKPWIDPKTGAYVPYHALAEPLAPGKGIIAAVGAGAGRRPGSPGDHEMDTGAEGDHDSDMGLGLAGDEDGDEDNSGVAVARDANHRARVLARTGATAVPVGSAGTGLTRSRGGWTENRANTTTAAADGASAAGQAVTPQRRAATAKAGVPLAVSKLVGGLEVQQTPVMQVYSRQRVSVGYLYQKEECPCSEAEKPSCTHTDAEHWEVISHLKVHSDHQGRGVGIMIFSGLLELMARSNRHFLCRWMELSVYSDNGPARYVYEKRLGFQMDGEPYEKPLQDWPVKTKHKDYSVLFQKAKDKARKDKEKEKAKKAEKEVDDAIVPTRDIDWCRYHFSENNLREFCCKWAPKLDMRGGVSVSPALAAHRGLIPGGSGALEHLEAAAGSGAGANVVVGGEPGANGTVDSEDANAQTGGKFSTMGGHVGAGPDSCPPTVYDLRRAYSLQIFKKFVDICAGIDYQRRIGAVTSISGRGGSAKRARIAMASSVLGSPGVFGANADNLPPAVRDVFRGFGGAAGNAFGFAPGRRSNGHDSDSGMPGMSETESAAAMRIDVSAGPPSVGEGLFGIGSKMRISPSRSAGGSSGTARAAPGAGDSATRAAVTAGAGNHNNKRSHAQATDADGDVDMGLNDEQDHGEHYHGAGDMDLQSLENYGGAPGQISQSHSKMSVAENVRIPAVAGIAVGGKQPTPGAGFGGKNSATGPGSSGSVGAGSSSASGASAAPTGSGNSGSAPGAASSNAGGSVANGKGSGKSGAKNPRKKNDEKLIDLRSDEDSDGDPKSSSILSGIRSQQQQASGAGNSGADGGLGQSRGGRGNRDRDRKRRGRGGR